MKKLLILIAVTLITLPCTAQSLVDDHGDDAGHSTHIDKNVWVPGVLQLEGEEDWFAFGAVAGSEYSIVATSLGALSSSILFLYNTDGAAILAQSNEWDGTENRIGWTCENSGIYYVVVKSYGGETGTYYLTVQSLSEFVKHAMQLVYNDQTHHALQVFEGFVTTFPDDPEINLYVAFLRLLDVVETPDARLRSLLEAFGTEIDIFPESKPADLITEVSQSTARLSEVKAYTVDVVLPKIDASLHNLEKVFSAEDVHIVVPANVVAATERIETDWVEIDGADAQMLAGGLLITKSMILAISAFDLGVEPKVISNRFPNWETPIDLEELVIQYPDLLTGQPDIQELFRASLQNWLMGTAQLRSGLQAMSARTAPQVGHLFYLPTSPDPEDPTLNARNAALYLTLLDRVFMGLLAVTGGDLNGDTRVDNWDLYTLRTLFENRR